MHASLLLAAAQARDTAAQQAPAAPPASHDLTHEFAVAPQLTVTLWAESPALHNPTAIDVDARGRVWVAEAVNYRKWQGRNPGLGFEGGDRIVILEDQDGDGRCDSSKVFAQSKELVAPLGIAVFGTRVIVSCSPTAWVFTDDDGDDVADHQEPLLTGFGGFDHDHGLHSFVGGFDGRLWFNVGNAGPHLVRDALGWNLRSGSIYNDGGPTIADNKPNLRSDDGRVWTGGLVLSVGTDGAGLAVRSHNFRNNYEVALDSFGNAFQTDNDDGPPVSRTLWCMEGGNHGFFSEDGARFWSADARPGQTIATAHWHAEDPGVVPSGCVHGSGGPTGLCVYEGTLLRGYEGFVLDADAGRNVVYAHRPVAAGAGYVLEHGVFLEAKLGAGNDERAQQFRPSDVAVGIDGSVYVADWFDPGVGGHAMADRVGYGRILRVAPSAQRFANPRLGFMSTEATLSAYLSPAANVRFQAYELLVAQGQSIVKRVKAILKAPNPRHVARASWLLAALGDEGRAAVREQLSVADPELRLTALRALRAHGADPVELAKFVVDDADPRVVAELALALRDIPWSRCGEVLRRLADKPWVEADPYYLTALGIAASGKERELWNALSFSFDPLRPVPDRVFWLAWRLRVDEALPILRHVAASEGFKPAVDALGFLASRAAAEAMLELALVGRAEIRDYAAWWVRFRGTNTWREFDLSRQLGDFDRARAKRVWSSGPRTQSALEEVEIPLAGQETVMLAVTQSDNGMSYDWADWIAPRFVLESGESVDLCGRPWVRADAGYGSVRIGASCEGGPLKVDGATYAVGIGTHAPSEIVFRVPKGARKLVTQFSVDDYGSDRAGSETKVEFEVWLPDASAALESSAFARLVADSATPAADREYAAKQLLATAEGALALVHLAATGRLSESLRDSLATGLCEHVDPAVRALAAQHFRRTDGRAELKPERVLALEGDRRRGEAQFFGASASCGQCHGVRGRGGDIGPDLSEIRRKYARSELLDHILHPSKAIDFGYQTWTVETASGRILSGFLLAGSLAAPGDGVVVLKTTSGQREIIEEREIESARRQELSLMPGDVALGLDEQGLADVLAFLNHDPAAAARRGQARALFDGRTLDGWDAYSSDPQLRRDDVWSVRDGVLHCAGRPAGYLYTETEYTNFVLELDWRWDPSEPPSNSGVLLRRSGAHKVWPRAIEAQLMHRNAGDIWNIDEFPMRTDPQRTSGRHTAKLAPSNEHPVGEWNHYRITLDEGALTLEVNGVLQNSASWCEERAGSICLQAEGSAIEFKDIVLTPIER